MWINVMEVKTVDCKMSKKVKSEVIDWLRGWMIEYISVTIVSIKE